MQVVEVLDAAGQCNSPGPQRSGGYRQSHQERPDPNARGLVYKRRRCSQQNSPDKYGNQSPPITLFTTMMNVFKFNPV